LVVMNTIKSSIDVYKHLSSSEKLSDFNLVYLSTNIIPFERKARIELIKKLIKAENKLLVVSTQVVEAGVDIDVDLVVRDMGPLDSIIQVAGRCNRNNMKEKRSVHIYRVNDGRMEYYKYIYKPGKLCEITARLLNFRSVEESEFYHITLEYFTKAYELVPQQKKLVDSVKELRYDWDRDEKPISSFKLIEELPEEELFVELPDTMTSEGVSASQIKDEFREIMDIKNSFERRRQFIGMKSRFRQYIISMNPKCAPIHLERIVSENENTPLLLPKKKIQDYYNLQTKKEGRIITGYGFERGIDNDSWII